jgi:cell wall-associated NlpC family hydrolase
MADNLIRKGVVTAALVSAGVQRARPAIGGGSPPDQPEAWAARFIGIPWKELGRGRDGCDCWGLHRLILKEQFGCAAPAYQTGYAGCGRDDVAEIAALIAVGKIGWITVAEYDPATWLCPLGAERPGDSLLIRQHGAPCHIGLVAGGRHMLHIEEGIDSVCVPYDDSTWRRRIVGIYRHPGLVQT